MVGKVSRALVGVPFADDPSAGAAAAELNLNVRVIVFPRDFFALPAIAAVPSVVRNIAVAVVVVMTIIVIDLVRLAEDSLYLGLRHAFAKLRDFGLRVGIRGMAPDQRGADRSNREDSE